MCEGGRTIKIIVENGGGIYIESRLRGNNCREALLQKKCDLGCDASLSTRHVPGMCLPAEAD